MSCLAVGELEQLSSLASHADTAPDIELDDMSYEVSCQLSLPHHSLRVCHYATTTESHLDTEQPKAQYNN